MISTIWRQHIRNVLLYPVIILTKLFLQICLYTCRFEIHGKEQFVKAASQGRLILMFWHNRFAILPEIVRRFIPQFDYCAIISNSRDGELLATLLKSYPMAHPLRVPHNARHTALMKIIHQLKEKGEIVIVAPDGPRGPRYEVKPGIALAAIQAEANIVPMTWSANRFWQFNTWDKLMLPKPFSRIQVTFGSPVSLPPSAIDDLGAASKQLQEMMFKLDR